jgi:hypothetical protein
VQFPTTRPTAATAGERVVTIDTGSARLLYRLTVAQAIVSLTGSVLTPLLLAIMVSAGMRRLRASTPPEAPIREAHSSESLHHALGASLVEQFPVAFEFGPTFDEERRQKEAESREHEAAMLRTIFEQNLHLREQLGGQAAGTDGDGPSGDREDMAAA